MIGQVLDRYRIESKLGEGGMGVVYRARDTQLDRVVAIKVLPHDKVADPARKQRFIQEARAAIRSDAGKLGKPHRGPDRLGRRSHHPLLARGLVGRRPDVGGELSLRTLFAIRYSRFAIRGD
jgi:serine/threonine protein kinase